MTDSSAPLPDDAALMDALWSLVAERGWQSTTLPALAERAGIDLPTLRGAVPTKFSLLCRHARLVDQDFQWRVDRSGGVEAFATALVEGDTVQLYHSLEDRLLMRATVRAYG